MTAPSDGRLGVDPRLRARRQDVLRQQGRQRLRRVQASVAVVIAGGLAWAAAMSPLLDVDQVVVRGADSSSAEAIERAAGVRLGSALATLDLGRVRAAAESVPWVDSAAVTRSWPGSVLISVTERRALAAARVSGGGWVLVDADRQLARTDQAELAGLPRVLGAVAEARPGAPLDDAARGALALAALLDDVVASGSGTSPSGEPEIVVGPDGALDLSLWSSGGPALQVRLGRPIDLEEKVRAVRALLHSGSVTRGQGKETDENEARSSAPVSTGDVIVIDVRVPSAPVVSRGAS